MREFLDDYDQLFQKWSDQRLKINEIEREILFLEADLRSEKNINSKVAEGDLQNAVAELDLARARLKKLEDAGPDGVPGTREAGLQVRSAQEYLSFVRETYEEQNRLWELGYCRQSLRISNLKERLNVEEAILAKYTAMLDDLKRKLQLV